MEKALELLFGIRKNVHSSRIKEELSFSTCIPISRPGMLEWFKKYNVSILTDKQSTNVPIRMGNLIKYVDLRSIKQF